MEGKMKTSKKIMIGGLGALTPVIMNLLVVDLDVLLVKVTFLAFLGYFIRVVVLFYLGGITAFLHKKENSAVKIFELGIVAPALITAMINAGNIEVPKVVDGTASVSISFVSPAYAQPTEEPREEPREEPMEQPVEESTGEIREESKEDRKMKTFSLPEESPVQQLWRGLTGSSPKKVWFVIAGSHQKLKDAREQVKQIAEEKEGLTAEIFDPYGENPYYAVVIGANLEYKEAQKIRQDAIKAGFSKDTYLWTFPK